MAQVVVTIAGRTYRMNCEDGQEGHLQGLARDIDARTNELRGSFGEIGDQRLVVMTALTIADELDAANRKIAALEAEVHNAQTGIEQTNAEAQARVAELEAAFDAAALRVNRLIDVLNPPKG